MRSTSRESQREAERRLDQLVAESDVDPDLVAAELFSVTDLLDGQRALRSALTDPGRASDAKRGLIRALLEGKVTATTLELADHVVTSRWSEARDLSDAFEHLAMVAAALAAEKTGSLEQVENEVFRFERVVAGEPSLRAALTDRALPAQRKLQVLDALLAGKASTTTRTLASRAATTPRGWSFEHSIERFGLIAAARRKRLIATVTAARPLSDDQQTRVATALRGQYGLDVHLSVVVDASLIGGMKIAIGDEVIDGSVARRIDDARRRLTS